MQRACGAIIYYGTAHFRIHAVPVAGKWLLNGLDNQTSSCVICPACMWEVIDRVSSIRPSRQAWLARCGHYKVPDELLRMDYGDIRMTLQQDDWFGGVSRMHIRIGWPAVTTPDGGWLTE